MRYLYSLLIGLGVVFSVNCSSDSSAGKNEYPEKSVKKDRYPKKLDVDWTRLTHRGYQAKYVQIDFQSFPTSEALDRDILDFLDSDSTMTLDDRQIKQLQDLVSVKANFSEGECGTFYINGGIVIMKNDTIRGMIDMGCGYGQWNFYPENPHSAGRTFSDKGFELMTALLDDINVKNRKKK